MADVQAAEPKKEEPKKEEPKKEEPKKEEPKDTVKPQAESGAPSTHPESAKASLKDKIMNAVGQVLSKLKNIKSLLTFKKASVDTPLVRPQKKIGLSVKDFFIGIFQIPILVVKGSFGTKLIAIGFLICVTLGYVTGSKLLDKYLPKKLNQTVLKKEDRTSSSNSMNAFFDRQREISLAKDSMLYLEVFLAPITSKTDDVKYLQFELYAECDSPATARAVKERLASIRDQITSEVQGLEYEKIKITEGKEDLKVRIVKVMNKYLEKNAVHGSINRVFFTSLVFGR